jgi:hypothetical protein
MASPKLQSILAMFAFSAFIALTLLGAYLLGHVLAIAGRSFDRWMLGWFIAAVLVGVVLLWLMVRRLADPPAAPDRRAEAQAREDRFQASLEELRAALRSDPELTRYAALVGVDPSLRSTEVARAREARVKHLLRDPITAKYADRVFRGEAISDAAICYWENPSLPLLCEHLHPMESDLRLADPNLKPEGDRVIATRVNFRFPELKSRYGLTNEITFDEEELLPGRASDYYQGKQYVRCLRCPCVVGGDAFGTPFPPP